MNKPVAWTTDGKEVMRLDNDDDTLHTHPVKELTETNYETVFDGEKYTTKLVEPLVKELTDEEIKSCWEFESDCQQWAIEFARAILRKASEK